MQQVIHVARIKYSPAKKPCKLTTDNSESDRKATLHKTGGCDTVKQYRDKYAPAKMRRTGELTKEFRQLIKQSINKLLSGRTKKITWAGKTICMRTGKNITIFRIKIEDHELKNVAHEVRNHLHKYSKLCGLVLIDHAVGETMYRPKTHGEMREPVKQKISKEHHILLRKAKKEFIMNLDPKKLSVR